MGVENSMGLERVRHDLATKQQKQSPITASEGPYLVSLQQVKAGSSLWKVSDGLASGMHNSLAAPWQGFEMGILVDPIPSWQFNFPISNHFLISQAIVFASSVSSLRILRP